jgi:glycogen phosphorylase
MAVSPYLFLPPIPERLEGLAELATDLRWSWSHSADALWERIDPETWTITRNPWLILQTVSTSRLENLAQDGAFRNSVETHVKAHRESLAAKTVWFRQAHDHAPLSVAYFSMEFGLSEALPIYSGGLGILAGDHLKTSSDLGVPLVGVGLLYQQGYFRQALDANGGQIEFYPYNDPSQLPILPVRDREGEWLRIEVALPGRVLRLRAWEAKVGRLKLYLLDSNDPMNRPADQAITSELYGGGPEMRLQQEMALGIGGWRLLHTLGIEVDVCHLNEGHAALAILERVKAVMAETGESFPVAFAAVRAGNVFTTHTPVPAGFDRFTPPLATAYLGRYADELGLGMEGLLALGRRDPSDPKEPLNMAYLAIRGSNAVNGVSRLHGEVSRRIFQSLFPRWPRAQVPVRHVTNGIHAPSWDSAEADALWSAACGKERWLGDLDTIEDDLKRVSDETLWEFRAKGRRKLIEDVRRRLARRLTSATPTDETWQKPEQLLEPDVITIGFARRFAAYKRPDLLLRDPERLVRLLNNRDRPVQFIVAGKAHPLDREGKSLINAYSRFIRRHGVSHRLIFLVDYDMVLAEQLVQGVDLWLNTPRRPWEACGTSGMKVLVNGGLNLSELDGWWAEAYCPEAGWALGDGREHGEDPAWDAHEAEQLYRLLEEEVIPCFYDRDETGIPRAWVARMRKSMAELTPRFSSNRMVREYVDRFYLPAAQNYRERMADKAHMAVKIRTWQESIEKNWHRLRFGPLAVERRNDRYHFSLPVYLDGLEPGDVAVQIYADDPSGDGPEIYAMACGRRQAETQNAYLYELSIPAERSADDYTPRIIPFLNGAVVPLEAPYILWYR